MGGFGRGAGDDRRRHHPDRGLSLVPHTTRAVGVPAIVPCGDVDIVRDVDQHPSQQGERLHGPGALRYAPSLAASKATICNRERRPSLLQGNRFPVPKQNREPSLNDRVTRVYRERRQPKRWSATESRERQFTHFATHGLGHSTHTSARRYNVAFASDSLQDGLLTLGEMMQECKLTLRAELLVLSAGQTGLRDLKRAEGSIVWQRDC